MNIFTYVASLFVPAVVIYPFVDQPAAPSQSIVAENPIVAKSTVVDYTTLKDTGLSRISFSYLGFAGDIPDTNTINWNASARQLWNQKLEIDGVSGATRNAADDVVARYQTAPAEQMTIEQHINQLDDELTKVKADLNWGSICVDFDLDVSTCRSFVLTSYWIDAKALTAYSMTELMPYRNGEQNYALMNLYMTNGGRNFLDVVPALGDRYLSMGRYQFTSFAVGRDDDGLRPANRIGSYSAHYNIPGSVVSLTGIENDRAAYYFTVYNLLSLFRSMNENQLAKYDRFCDNHKAEMIQYIATAHHNPKWAKRRALEWINDRCTRPLISYQGERLEIYSLKTQTNYEYLQQI